MSVHQIEEYYVHLDNSEIDFCQHKEIRAVIEGDSYDCDFESDSCGLVVETFHSEVDAIEYECMLKEKFPA